MARKGLRRLDLWLPYNHPIFERSPGARAAVAREWLDVGARLAEVERRLAEVERQVSSVHALLRNARVSGSLEETESRKVQVVIDTAAFMEL
jgi:hypothetical protein